MIQIQNNALFIADSHYPNHGNDFLMLLQAIDSGRLKIPQLFLMGDNFDLLVGSLQKSHALGTDAIALLQSISKNIPTYYFEGNHDFQLKELFVDMTLYPRSDQPQCMQLGGLSVGLSHGDRYAVGMGHGLLSRVLRHKVFLWCVSPFQGKIIKAISEQLKRKKICNSIEGFAERVNEILQHYSGVDLVIEGHYHQAVVINNYISLPSLACQRQVGVVRDEKMLFVGLDDLLSTL